MPSLPLSHISTQTKHHKPYPPKRQRGLWRLIEPNEPMVSPIPHLEAQPIWYQSSDGFVGTVFYVTPTYFADKAPVVIMLGPLLHPKVVLSKTQPWIQALLDEGYPIYAISHRSHNNGQDTSLPAHDTSFETIVSEDIIASLDAINDHAGTAKLHLIGQDLGALMALHLMGCIDSGRFESIHLFNLPYRLPNSLRSLFLSYMHQNTSLRQVWAKHLHTGLIPDIVQELSLTERSALLWSDSWLAKDWVRTLRHHQTIESLSFTSNILLLKALPLILPCPVHLRIPVRRRITYFTPRYQKCEIGM